MSGSGGFDPILLFEGDMSSPTWWRIVWGEFSASFPGGNYEGYGARPAGYEDQPGNFNPESGGGHWEWDPNLTVDGKGAYWIATTGDDVGGSISNMSSNGESGMWVWVPDDWSYTPEGNGHWQWNYYKEEYEWVLDDPQP